MQCYRTFEARRAVAVVGPLCLWQGLAGSGVWRRGCKTQLACSQPGAAGVAQGRASKCCVMVPPPLHTHGTSPKHMPAHKTGREAAHQGAASRGCVWRGAAPAGTAAQPVDTMRPHSPRPAAAIARPLSQVGLLTKAARQADCVAATAVKCLTMSRDAFERLMGPGERGWEGCCWLQAKLGQRAPGCSSGLRTSERAAANTKASPFLPVLSPFSDRQPCPWPRLSIILPLQWRRAWPSRLPNMTS